MKKINVEKKIRPRKKVLSKYEKEYAKMLREIDEGKKQSPLKAIRLKCLQCTFFQDIDCRQKNCILYQFRRGKNLTGKQSPKLPTIRV